MAVPTKIEKSFGTGNPPGTAVITHSATPSDGELLLAMIQIERGSDAALTTIPTGFALLDTQLGHTTGAAGGPSVLVYYKVAASEAGATYTWLSTVGRGSVSQYRFSGAGTPTVLGKNTSAAGAVTTLDIANGSQAIAADTYALAHLAMQTGEAPTWTDSFTAETNDRTEIRLATRQYTASGTAQPIPTWTTGQRARSIFIAVPAPASGFKSAWANTNTVLKAV